MEAVFSVVDEAVKAERETRMILKIKFFLFCSKPPKYYECDGADFRLRGSGPSAGGGGPDLRY